jgi:serine/threonine protein kinase
MEKLKKPISFETTFGTYIVDECLGQGGAGRVFGGTDADGAPIALKVLSEKTTTDKRRRFKNEISFLQKNKHKNIVTVVDHGLSRGNEASEPFYIMRRYDCSLRELMKRGIEPDQVLAAFSQIIDGVEAAHLQGVLHRDLKPENILSDQQTNTIAIADFGVARFTEDFLATTVETEATQRLANFVYAAPEQLIHGELVGETADIYALGLILNEMFTGRVPRGTGAQSIGAAAGPWAFLDPIVDRMLRQSPAERPQSIEEVKHLIMRHQAEAVSLQRLEKIEGTVVDAEEIDEPLAISPPKLIDFDWNQRQLTLMLDRPVTRAWIQAFYRMGVYQPAFAVDPGSFVFNHDRATVSVQEHQAQTVIDNFKSWLPLASQNLRDQLEGASRQRQFEATQRLRRERTAEEERLRVNRGLKI